MSESAEDCLQDAQEGLAHMRGAVRLYVACIAGLVIFCVAGSLLPYLKESWRSGKIVLVLAPGSRQSESWDGIAKSISALSSLGVPVLAGRFWKARKLTWRFRTHINRLSRAIALDPHDPHDSLHRDCEDLEKKAEEV
jgi:hypothetical protein